MNKRTAIKIFIDAAMLILYLQLTFMYDHNPLYHEVAGISLAVLFAVHVGMNIRETKSLIRRRRIAFLALDFALLASVAVSVVTGLLVAEELFVGPGNGEVVLVHNTAAYIGLGAIAVHLLMHVKYLSGVFGLRGKSVKAAQDASPVLASEKAAQYSRRAFAKKAALAGAAAFAAASVVVLEAPAIGKLFSVEEPASDSPVLRNANEERKRSVSERAEASGPNDEEKSSGVSGGHSSADVSSDDSSDDSEVRCTLCRKNCPLSNLRCSRGVDWATENGYL